MKITLVARFPSKLIGASFVLTTLAAAQDLTPPRQANPAPGCSVTVAQLESNTSGETRVALLDPAYKQHNPVVVRKAQQENLSDYEEAKKSFLEQDHGTVHGLGLGPTPPGNRFEIVTAECDIVTVVHSGFRHDPTGESKFYEAFTFDTFRVKGGKLVEHWDGASLSAPASTPSSTAKSQ